MDCVVSAFIGFELLDSLLIFWRTIRINCGTLADMTWGYDIQTQQRWDSVIPWRQLFRVSLLTRQTKTGSSTLNVLPGGKQSDWRTKQLRFLLVVGPSKIEEWDRTRKPCLQVTQGPNGSSKCTLKPRTIWDSGTVLVSFQRLETSWIYSPLHVGIARTVHS